MTGSATFETTAEDEIDAINTYAGRAAGVLAWLALLLAEISFGVSWWYGRPMIEDQFGWACLIACVLLFGWDKVGRSWMIRRQFRQSLKMRTPIRLSWDDQAITFDTDLSHAVYPWAGFFGWNGSKTSLLLYRDSAMFFPIPRRALSEGDYERMTDALRAHGVRELGKPQSAQSRPMSS